MEEAHFPAEAPDRQVRNLLLALETRTLIGQATGILMERYHLGPRAAVAALIRLSSTSHRNMRAIAVELVEKGHVHGL